MVTVMTRVIRHRMRAALASSIGRQRRVARLYAKLRSDGMVEAMASYGFFWIKRNAGALNNYRFL